MIRTFFLFSQEMVMLEKTIDSQLRGIGIYGQVAVTLKNFGMDIYERSQEKRPDDNEEIAAKRYETYEKSTEPIIEYYKKLNLLKVIDGERSIDQINKEISDIIDLI